MGARRSEVATELAPWGVWQNTQISVVSGEKTSRLVPGRGAVAEERI
jgi:hypothetical protein